MLHVAYRAMLEAVCGGCGLSHKPLRGLKYGSIEHYAKTVAANIASMLRMHACACMLMCACMFVHVCMTVHVYMIVC